MLTILRKGTAKAGKLVEAIKKIKDNAEKIRAKLESHLSFISKSLTHIIKQKKKSYL